MQRKEGAYLQVLTLPFHFWLLLLASYFCPFVSSTFSLASSSFQAKEKKEKHKEKKTIKKKKMQRREGTYLSYLVFAFGMKHSSCFLLSTFLLGSPPSSSLVSHVSSKLYGTQARELSQALEME
jgi:Na+/H+ antiporter NhaD/arsenite permease-like protein